MKKLYVLLLILILFVFPRSSVHADVAPPESPPGANLVPGSGATQVRMIAETVTLTISKDPVNPREAIAKTQAVFTMRNLGDQEEKMRARFPLSFFNGNSDGMGNFPEIKSIAVKINGKTIPTKREMQPFFNSEMSYHERAEIPWTVFDITFPPAQDVTIEVAYPVNGFGYYPYEVFKYILETGAGWNGTIGAADIIIRFPYQVNQQNVWMKDVYGYSAATSDGAISGNEVRWHFEELEPTWENNIMVVVVTPSLWEAILQETDTVTKNPNDGEAWGRLAKAYKEILLQKHGELRTDPAGREMYDLSKSAYEKCLALLPNDSLWHYGYANLLWSHYYFDLYFGNQADVQEILPRTLSELETALALDPNNQQAKDLLTEISYSIPEAVKMEGDKFILLGLTATPIPPTPYAVLTETPEPTPTLPVQMEATPTLQVSVAPTKTPTTNPNPICGSAFILPALFSLIFVLKRRRDEI